MNYKLSDPTGKNAKKSSPLSAARRMMPFLKDRRLTLVLALCAMLVNTAATLVGPVIVGHTIDTYVVSGLYGGVIAWSLVLLVIYVVSLGAAYAQTMLMGTVGQSVLFTLRNAVFQKLQELPIAFFNQNKAGDLISRINSDTDKLNQFFSQALVQFVANLFVILGAGAFLLFLNPRLGGAALAPAVAILVFTQLVSGWVRRRNAVSLKSTGDLSAEISESLENFRAVVAFDRRDYFRARFAEVNEENFKASVSAGLASNVFIPVYGFGSQMAQLIVLGYGVALIVAGQFTVGLLISFVAYVLRFYDPLRQMANLWSSFQTAMAAWDRIEAILSLENDMTVATSDEKGSEGALLEFRNVRFGYPEGKEVLHDVSFALEPGKTYALVGPTGGGKTTTASLMARLYDPTGGRVFLEGRDIRSVEPSERVRRIGFILQEPFLFTGTVRDNILYGNERYRNHTDDQLAEALATRGLDSLLGRFDKGLATAVTNGGAGMSLGQRQLIAFMRAVLRDPALLILDEATANIDTVTEQLLEEILRKLPKETTKVIIAHRLNTIEAADEIFFVNDGEVVRAGSMQHAVEMLLSDNRVS